MDRETHGQADGREVSGWNPRVRPAVPAAASVNLEFMTIPGKVFSTNTFSSKRLVAKKHYVI